MKLLLLNWLISKILPTDSTPYTQEEELEILEKMHQIPGIEKYLEALLNNDLRFYFKINEKDSELRLIRKGMMWRTNSQLNSMRTASEKLDKLIKKE